MTSAKFTADTKTEKYTPQRRAQQSGEPHPTESPMQRASASASSGPGKAYNAPRAAMRC